LYWRMIMPRSLSPYPSRQESCKPQQSRLSQKNSAEHPGRLVAVAPIQEMNCSLISRPSNRSWYRPTIAERCPNIISSEFFCRIDRQQHGVGMLSFAMHELEDLCVALGLRADFVARVPFPCRSTDPLQVPRAVAIP